MPGLDRRPLTNSITLMTHSCFSSRLECHCGSDNVVWTQWKNTNCFQELSESSDGRSIAFEMRLVVQAKLYYCAKEWSKTALRMLWLTKNPFRELAYRQDGIYFTAPNPEMEPRTGIIELSYLAYKIFILPVVCVSFMRLIYVEMGEILSN